MASGDDTVKHKHITKATDLLTDYHDTVPGQPLIPLERSLVLDFLYDELSTKRLAKIYSILRLASNRNNISPLHHQAVKGRKIVITERPDLHLIWFYDRIFIKPIPPCLFGPLFYRTYVYSVNPNCEIQNEVRGFLRTYSRLIVHESDFKVAVSLGLLPEGLEWIYWCYFIKDFRDLRDSEVSVRYHYGEIRLTRLNFYSKFFFYGWNYFEMYHQYTTYFARFMAPYLFVFGGVSVILAAMQTDLTANPDSIFAGASHGFATFCIILTIAGLAFFPLLYVLFQIKESLMYIFRHQQAT